VSAEVAVDARGRASLAAVRTRDFGRYAAEELADGTIILRPLVSVDPAELAALKDPAVRRAVESRAGGPSVVSGCSG
jgi:hypothetical protein